MQLQRILNRVEKQKGFVYSSIRWANSQEQELEVLVRPHARSRPICSGCNRKGPTYDTQPSRRFEFVPLWAIPVFFVYAMRRVDCRRCGVKVERVPWSDGKHRTTFSYRLFLSRWAKRMSWKETAQVFGTSWDTVYRSVRWVVRWGIVHRDIGSLEAIGIDEIQYRRGHRYLTLVYQIDAHCRRLLYVTQAQIMEWVGHKGSDMVKLYRHLRTDDSHRHMSQLDFGTGNPKTNDPGPVGS